MSDNPMRRCKMCGKLKEIKSFRIWGYRGKLYRGCTSCHLNMINKIFKKVKTREDDIL